MTGNQLGYKFTLICRYLVYLGVCVVQLIADTPTKTILSQLDLKNQIEDEDISYYCL